MRGRRAPGLSPAKLNGNKNGTIEPQEKTNNQIVSEKPGVSNVESQTPAFTNVQGNSFCLEFPDDKEHKEYEILWGINVPDDAIGGPTVDRDL